MKLGCAPLTRFSKGSRFRLSLWVVVTGVWTSAACAAPVTNASLHAVWPRGSSPTPGFFPLAVWLQDPANASRYLAAGINTYVGLWEGPTEAQLASLKKAGMRVICEQNEVALRHLDDPTIIGWMHCDEPDNAQSLGPGKGWGPPVLPRRIVEEYARIRANDPARPVMLNLGQGVAWDGWYGRGSRSHHPEDYAEYLQGCDIASFDIYPVVHDSPEVSGKLWFVARGVERLSGWAGTNRLVWNCLECTHISNPNHKPTPQQVRCEAWMSLIHGSRGLIYFVHQFKPKFREPALLDDSEMLQAVTALNRQITELAPVLNSPDGVKFGAVSSEDSAVPIAARLLRHAGTNYVFAVAMRAGTTTATFKTENLGSPRTVEVIGEQRSLECRDGSFQDHFGRWAVHLYSLHP